MPVFPSPDYSALRNPTVMSDVPAWMQRILASMAPSGEVKPDVSDFDVSAGFEVPGPGGVMAPLIALLSRDARRKAAQTLPDLIDPKEWPGIRRLVERFVSDPHAPSTIGHVGDIDLGMPGTATMALDVVSPGVFVKDPNRPFRLAINAPRVEEDLAPSMMLNGIPESARVARNTAALVHESTHIGQQLRLMDRLSREIYGVPFTQLDPQQKYFLLEQGMHLSTRNKPLQLQQELNAGRAELRRQGRPFDYDRSQLQRAFKGEMGEPMQEAALHHADLQDKGLWDRVVHLYNLPPGQAERMLAENRNVIGLPVPEGGLGEAVATQWRGRQDDFESLRRKLEGLRGTANVDANVGALAAASDELGLWNAMLRGSRIDR